MRGRRAVLTLAAAQALGLSGAPLVVMVGGVLGRELAPAPALATLPLAAMVVGTALTSAPAALLMQRIGRRHGLVAGALLGGLGAAIAAVGIVLGSFPVFCAATLLIGANLAFVMQYRFAAAEAAGAVGTDRAVALVLAGGIVAGILGPELGRRGQALLDTPWTGSFVLLAALQAVLATLLAAGLAGWRASGGASPPAGEDTRPDDRSRTGAAASPGVVGTAPDATGSVALRLLRTPSFILPAAAGITAYAVMSLIMTATPLAMHGTGFHVDATAVVIQAHVVAMYAPSLIAGPLAARLGLRRLLACGIVGLALCVGIGLSAAGLAAWIAALALLGVGWNLLFLGGTVALARAFPGEDRFRAQALNDGLVFGTQAVASLGSGVVLAAGGWTLINVVALVPLALMATLVAVSNVRTAVPRPAG